MRNKSFLYWFYRKLSYAAYPFFKILLKQRLRAGKEHKTRFRERWGETSLKRPKTRLLWCHGASVGEILALLPLCKVLLEDDGELHILLTSGTLTSAKLLEERLPPRTIHQFLPLDHPVWIARFFNHWKPDAGVMVDSDFWPNLLFEAKHRALPLALLNARLSPKSSKRYRRFGKTFACSLLESFDCIIAQDESQYERLKGLGAKLYPKTLSLKTIPQHHNKTAVTCAQKLKALSSKPFWLAASTHAGEEALVLDTHNTLSERTNLIIVPRHPERSMEILMLAQMQGFDVKLLSKLGNDLPSVLIVDSIGILNALYEICILAYVGGSLNLDLGGHNLQEPARAGVLIAHGPDIANQQSIAAILQNRRAAHTVTNAQELETLLHIVLDTPQKAKLWTIAGKAALDNAQEALVFFKTLIQTLLKQKKR